jgi:EmrB/QacA subfamily drug resistance transporter
MITTLILEVGRMAATAPAAPAAPADDKVDPKVIKTGLILVVGILAVVFDTTIVSVALHTLVTQLHSSVSTIQWVSTGYLLALGMTVPLSTWGLRRYGGKRLWMFALTVFLVGSIGSSLAWNADALIAWRVVQGAGGGLLLSVLTTLIMQAAGGKSLGRTVTLIALPALLGPILGPLIGGAILTHLSWRFMFWVNVPFCLIGLVLAAKYLPKDAIAPVRPKLDILGFALLAPGIAAVILGLSNAGAAAGFGHADVLIPLAIGVVLVAAFCLHALRKSDPLADIRLLAHRSVASSSAVLFFSGFTLYGAMLLLPLFYQEARGATALSAGIMLVPQGVGALLSRSPAGRLTDKIGGRPVALVGFAVIAIATIPFCYADPKTNSWLLALWLLVRGAGLGAVTISVTAVGYLGLDRAEIPHASVLTRTAQQIGGSFGTAVLAVVLESAVTAHRGNLTAAFNIAFWWSVGFAALAALLSFCLPGRPRPAGQHRPEEPRSAGGRKQPVIR